MVYDIYDIYKMRKVMDAIDAVINYMIEDKNSNLTVANELIKMRGELSERIFHSVSR